MGEKRRRLVGVVTPRSAGILAFGTFQRRGVVMVKYFFGDRSESVASHFVPFKIRRVPNMLIGTKVPKSQPIVSGLIAMSSDVGTMRDCRWCGALTSQVFRQFIGRVLLNIAQEYCHGLAIVSTFLLRGWFSTDRTHMS